MKQDLFWLGEKFPPDAAFALQHTDTRDQILFISPLGHGHDMIGKQPSFQSCKEALGIRTEPAKKY